MMIFVRWFIFAMFFAIDIKVKASSSAMIARPSGCAAKSSICAIQTKTEPFHFSKGPTEFHLAKQTLIVRNSIHSLELIKGVLWVQKNEKFKVQTIFGEVTSAKGPFWVLQENDKIWVRNVNSDLNIKLRDGRTIEVPIGFQIWISGLDENGRSTMGIPEAIPLESHLYLWSQLYQGTREEFKTEVSAIKWTWGQLPERASQLYIKIAQRQQQLADERAARAQKRMIAEENEKKRMKSLYFEKAFYR